jgi:hypothetical protein
MIKNKVVEEKVEVADLIICDVCKKEYSYDKDILDIQEFVHINTCAGYGSIFGDGSTIKIDICQHCLDNKLGEYLRIGSQWANIEEEA